jgi:hypothetical protein
MTAIEWFYETIINDPLGDWEYYFKQAKQMEKKQIIDAHGNQTKKSRGISNYTYILTGEEYYNQTFKNK